MRIRFGNLPMSKAILYDATIGIDCKLCEKACAERKHLPYNDKIAAGFTIFALAVKYLPIFRRVPSDVTLRQQRPLQWAKNNWVWPDCEAR